MPGPYELPLPRFVCLPVNGAPDHVAALPLGQINFETLYISKFRSAEATAGSPRGRLLVLALRHALAPGHWHTMFHACLRWRQKQPERRGASGAAKMREPRATSAENAPADNKAY